jgi:hypothetical protein
MKSSEKSEYLSHCIIAVGFTTRHLFWAANGLKTELGKHFGDSLRVRVSGSK